MEIIRETRTISCLDGQSFFGRIHGTTTTIRKRWLRPKPCSTDAGFNVETAEGHICCGRPLYDFGFLDHARAYLGDVLERMAPHIEERIPFIFLEPSCASVFKDELLEFFPDDDRAKRLSEQVWLLADWLQANAPDWVPSRLEGAHVLVHGHCHHKAVFGGPASEIALLRRAGANVEPIKAGCCGMAGPFGFEAEKFAISKTIANDGLMPAVESAGPMTVLLADGFSCREQIQQLGHKQALHFAELLARSCGCGGIGSICRLIQLTTVRQRSNRKPAAAYLLRIACSRSVKEELVR